jgi:ribosomal protein S18 acetylase RimI-like enzyme
MKSAAGDAHEVVVIAERGGALLRHARDDDWPRVDEIAILCYGPIHESYVAMLGEECYQTVRHDPELTWQQRKVGQIHRLYREHPEWVWVTERQGTVIGFVTFSLVPEKSMGRIQNNGVHPEHCGQGWATFMYRNVLQHFRSQGLRFAFLDTGLDPAHAPARRAYEAVGFDRQVPVVEYWQDLTRRNPGSEPA